MKWILYVGGGLAALAGIGGVRAIKAANAPGVQSGLTGLSLSPIGVAMAVGKLGPVGSIVVGVVGPNASI